ncbi:G-type lectin S-receptor-like serine/threonine-protein kinase LECRK1 [Papaver somniferum]|uniref:G-type lectin S-receptor-like serine/threonine-protein kinase LECRK1 n=1 Tax=Papaver somniferum TaxID=3469 RepID=UPI000E6FE4B0|nr:G-type lectin S-receptor-like serine/threonine-protein kinase LECRK1 [Papaver somniferum]
MGVDSSPSPAWNDNFTSNITRGLYLSTSPSDTSYWLSPSGNIAFGFYKLPCSVQHSSSSNCDRYVVGIWFVKSALKTLVWTANRNHLPLPKPSSILFTNQGKLVLQVTQDNKEEPLIPDLQEPISYAKIHDNGNFVLYGSNSQIIWESFDYPTNTILGGQKLKAGVDLVSRVSDMFNPGSGEYKLSIRQTDGLVAVHKFSDDGTYTHVVSKGFKGSIMNPVTLNLDKNTGNLFLVSSDDVVLGKLYEDTTQQPTQEEQKGMNKVFIYRATLDSKGDFNLFKERIDGNVSATNDKSFNLVPLWSSSHDKWTIGDYILFWLPCSASACFAGAICYLWWDRKKKSIIGNWKSSQGDLELGK